MGNAYVVAVSFVPLAQTLDVYTPGSIVRDRFGNERPGAGEWKSVKVASWWIDKTEEKSGESVLRTIDYLHVHIPPGSAPSPGGKVRTPDGHEWTVEGNPEDYCHGWHGWNPGLLVIHAKKVEG